MKNIKNHHVGPIDGIFLLHVSYVQHYKVFCIKDDYWGLVTVQGGILVY